MTVNQLAERYAFRKLCVPDGEREVLGGYCGDLLSWVMGHAQADQVWVTIMSNVNILAVASLTDVACVVLAEGVCPEDDVVQTAGEKGINLLSCEQGAYEIAAAIAQAL